MFTPPFHSFNFLLTHTPLFLLLLNVLMGVNLLRPSAAFGETDSAIIQHQKVLSCHIFDILVLASLFLDKAPLITNYRFIKPIKPNQFEMHLINMLICLLKIMNLS